jgi:hypothetical protein
MNIDGDRYVQVGQAVATGLNQRQVRAWSAMPPKSGSELSCRDETGMNTMTETATVRASALAQHLDCSRTYISKLEAEGVIQRQGGGFPLDQSRVAYLRNLRRERRQSSRAEADAAHLAVKTEMLRLRLMERKRELVPRDAHEAMIDQMAGLVLTKLSGWPARIAGQDGLRRRAEAVLHELRVEISEACTKLADEQGEPPLDEQD